MTTKPFILLTALASLTLSAAPIRSLPGLTGITFFEVTGVPSPFTFAPNSPQLTTQIAGNLGVAGSDFTGTPNEYYDVFYSNANGTFNIDGEYVSIEANYTGPSSAGLNISMVQLLYGVNPVVIANTVTSFVGGATNFNPASVNNAVDGNVNTSTAMGITNATDRMRITVGFPSGQTNAVPEPSSFVLGALGVAGILGFRSRRRS